MPEPYLNSEGEFFSSGISHLLQNIQTFSSAEFSAAPFN